MPIHSIVSEFDIFNEYVYPQSVCKQINGGQVDMIKINGKYQVQRLHSTDPFMYLKKEYQPTHFYS